ncbi:MAG: O-antigen ligase family protein [Bacteroidales bacterium]
MFKKIGDVLNGRGYKLLALGLSLLFVFVNACLISRDYQVLNLVPFVLVASLLILFAPEKTFFLLVLLAPLSVPFSEFFPGLEFDFWFPTEPLLVTLLVLILLKSLHDHYFDKALVNHPIFWAILFYLGWLVIATVSSEMPIVSVKYTLVRFWFIAVFFYFSYLQFVKAEKNFKKYIGLFLTGLFVIVLISLNRQVARGLFDKYVAHGSCNPFFTDHTSYGAALALVIPVLIGFVFLAKRWWSRLLLLIASLFFVSALILSYSRAAWLSLFVAGGVWVIWYLRIRFRTLIIGGLLAVLLVFTFQEEIGRWLSYNQSTSSGNLQQHLNSVTNVKTDDSNVERLNRWTSAIRMFRERPFLGWGPGTYMFLYAPFQASYLKTIESSDLGAKGNAHSEYLGLLAEAGILAPIGYVLILIIVLYRGFTLVRLYLDRDRRIIVLSVLLGLITYVVHGLLNNFLDMDKIAAIFWGYIALVVAMDVKYRGLKKLESQN